MRDVPDLGPIRFRKHRDAGGALNATFVFLRRNARELATSYLALIVPVLLASALSAALWMSRLGDLFTDPLAMESDPFAIFNGAYVGTLLFGLLSGALMQAAAGGYVRLYREGEAGAVTVGALWDEAKGLILPYLGMTLLFGFVVMLSAIVVIVPCLGGLAWLAFFFWLLPHYSVAVAARALESESVAEAVARSRDLVKGSWGFAFGTLILSFLVLLVLYFAVMIAFSAVTSLVGLSATDPSGVLTAMSLMLVPLQLAYGVAYLVPLVAAFFIHGRLEEELEGTALADDLDTLAVGFDAAAPPRSTPPQSAPPQSDLPPEPPPADPEEPESRDAPGGGFRGGGFG